MSNVSEGTDENSWTFTQELKVELKGDFCSGDGEILQFQRCFQSFSV